MGNLPPAAPTGLAQYRSDGTTFIAAGGSIDQSTVVLKAQANDPEVDQVHLMVEVQLVGADFIGSATASGSFVVSGGTASVTLTNLAPGSYHWQATAMDTAGARSSWIGFGGNPETEADFVVVAGGPNTAPDVPLDANQYLWDGTTAIAIPPYATTASHYDRVVVFKATLTDPDSDNVRLLVEARTLATGFTGNANYVSDFVPGGTAASITVGSVLSNTSYHWQFAVQDANGATSAWTSFGGNTEADSDFRASATGNLPPDVPTAPIQSTSGGSVAATGASVTDGTIVFKGTLIDINGNCLRLQIELRPLSMAFSGTPNGESYFIANGQQASVTFSGLNGSYHWQYRAMDSNQSPSAWASFGGNSEAVADFTVVSPAVDSGAEAQSGGGGGCGAIGLEFLLLLGLIRLARRVRRV